MFAGTRSENLITIVILAIVIIISSGTIVADNKKNNTVIKLEKKYVLLSESLKKSEKINGSYKKWLVADGDNNGSYLFFKDYLSYVLPVLKDCNVSTKGDCNYEFKELNGTSKVLDSSWARFKLSDGTFLALKTNCDENYKVVYFYLDTNGKKRLNVVARDIFIFEYWIKNNLHPEWEGILFPYGHQYSKKYLVSLSDKNNCNLDKNGNYCAALLMLDNWQMTPDYPWAQARYFVQ